MFLDDVPTFSVTGMLHYLIGRSKQALGMVTEARKAFDQFLAPPGNEENARAAQFLDGTAILPAGPGLPIRF